MTQIALSEPNSIYLLVSRGFSPQEARDALGQLVPAASYDGCRYFYPQAVYTAASEGPKA